MCLPACVQSPLPPAPPMRAAPTRFFQPQTLPTRPHGAGTKASIPARGP